MCLLVESRQESPLLKIHHLFLRHRLYPLLASTALVFFFFAVRVFLSGERTYIFLIWNLFLAWLPYWFSLAAYSLFHRPKRRWLLIVSFSALWLLFLPNAPYIMTDLLHLTQRDSIPLWFDVGFLISIGMNGLFLAIASLRAMQVVVEKLAGPVLSWLFVLTGIGLSGLGVYMGRFLRWNSWDILNNPLDILKDTARPLIFPQRYTEELGFIFMFAALLLVGYLMLAPAGTPSLIPEKIQKEKSP